MSSPNTPIAYYSLYLFYTSSYISYTASYVFNFGLQAGFSFLLTIVLLALTRPSKRRTPIFLLNICALTACTIRVILCTSYFWSESWSSLIATVSYVGDAANAPRWHADDPYTWRGQMVAAFFAALQSTAIFISLFLQIKAVCAPMVVKWQQRSMMLLTGLIALANIFLAWLHTILQMATINELVLSHGQRWSLGVEYLGLWQLVMWINQASIAYFSLVFGAKLAVAMAMRRRMGVRQFGAMEVVCIMALQTMLVPAILTIIQPYTTMPAFGSTSLTLVTISLPFSAVWAAESMPAEQDADSSSRRSTPNLRTKLFGAHTPRRMSSATPSTGGERSPIAGSETPRSIRLWRWSWKGGKSKGRESGTVSEVEELEKHDV